VVPIESLSVSGVVELTNEYADATRSAAGESDESYPALDELDIFGATAVELVVLADALYAVFAESAHAVELLNDLADQHGLSHRLGSDGRLMWARRTSSDSTAAAATAALIDFLDEYGPDRFGTCEANDCVDVYVDTSQGKNRSFCSDRCHSRTRVARWRSRQQHVTST